MLFATELVSGLLVVTNFLELSDVLLVPALAMIAGVGVLTGFAGAAFGAVTGFAAFFAGATGAAFLAGSGFAATLAGTGFAACFAPTFFAGAPFASFFAGGADAFDTGLAAALPDAPTEPRAAGFMRAGAFAACALLPAFCLLFTIPRPIL